MECRHRNATLQWEETEGSLSNGESQNLARTKKRQTKGILDLRFIGDSGSSEEQWRRRGEQEELQAGAERELPSTPERDFSAHADVAQVLQPH